jgi:hypothetical protein
MTRARLVLWSLLAFGLLALLWSPDADADPAPPPVGPTQLPAGGGNPGVGAEGSPEAQLAPGEAVFLCPGVGGSATVLGAGGGYCDFNFVTTRYGVGHIHCEWGGASPIVSIWNCWRVFPGRPDHPALPDPDIIPDGWGVPNALSGPTRDDQWPPPGLAPAAAFAPPPPPEEIPGPFGPPTGPPPGPPPP